MRFKEFFEQKNKENNYLLEEEKECLQCNKYKNWIEQAKDLIKQTEEAYKVLKNEYNKLLKVNKELERENLKLKKMLQEKPPMQQKQQQISIEDIEKIKELRGLGCSYSQIASDVGWSKYTVSKVLNGHYDKPKDE